ncbi:MAG: type II secretion system protein GspK [Pseudomonadota bacterium]|nr:type II secretion system protein GspK [Pseudomonadota bacterium]
MIRLSGRRGQPDAEGRRDERGFVLVIVLFSLVLLALIIAELGAAGRQESNLADNLRRGAVLGAAADGAVHEAIFHLLAAGGDHWAADGGPHAIAVPGGQALVRILSEAGKINPNTARPELLVALLREAGVPGPQAVSLTTAIVAWRTPPRQAPSTADDYHRAGLDYAPPQAPFESVRELGDVLGMTPLILQRLLPHLSLYNQGDPDPQAADPVVLRAIEDVYGNVTAVRRPLSPASVALVQVLVRGPEGAQAERSVVVQTGGTQGGATQGGTNQGGTPQGGGMVRILRWEDQAAS